MATVRYYAGSRAAAGCSEEDVRAASVGELRAALREAHGPELERVLKAATLLVDGLASHDDRQPLAAGAVVEVLPPFAGG